MRGVFALPAELVRLTSQEAIRDVSPVTGNTACNTKTPPRSPGENNPLTSELHLKQNWSFDGLGTAP